MAVYLQAPWDLIQTTMLLPSPGLGNTKELAIETTIRNSVNGTLYSYNKTNDRVKLSWDFTLRRGKAEELKAFMESYYGVEWRVTDWDEKVYKMYLVNNPLDLTFINRAGMVNVKLELEGTQL